MKPVPRSWRRPIAVAAVLGAVAASAYLWWWRPLMLATLKVGLERTLAGAKTGPRIAFQSLDLSGLNILVLKNVSIGTLDDPASAFIKEVRLTFDLGALVRGRLDWSRALRAVKLVEPQATVTMPQGDKFKNGGLPAIGPPPGASLDISRGKLLLRSKAGGASPVAVVADIDIAMAPAGKSGYDFSASLTPPGSPRHAVETRGTFVPGTSGETAAPADSIAGRIDGTLRLNRLFLAPLSPWLVRAGWKEPPREGAVSASLNIGIKRGPSGWRLDRTEGTVRTDRVTAVIPGLPVPVSEMTGVARVDSNSVRIDRMTLSTAGIPWKVAGTIEDPGNPRLKLDAATTEFDLERIAKDGKGKGSMNLAITGPAQSPAITAVADLASVSWQGVSFDRVAGSAGILEGGTTVKISGVEAKTPAGVLKITGTVKPRRPDGNLAWVFDPAAPGLPEVAGSLAIEGRSFRAQARTRDGLWALSGTGKSGTDGSWLVAVGGKSPDGARVNVEGSIGPAPARRLAGSVSVAKAPVAGLYLAGRSDVLKRLGAEITAAGRISGTAADPALKASVAGSVLRLPGRLQAVSAGSLILSRTGMELSRVRLPDGSVFDLVFPFDSRPVNARLDAEKLPLGAVWAAFLPGGPGDETAGALLSAEGFLHGALTAADLAGRPSVGGDAEVRELKWRGRALGVLSFAAEASGGRTAISRIKVNGPDCSAEGSGVYESGEKGWKASGKITIAYLKYGSDDLDAVAEVEASGRDASATAEVRLASVRINGRAYPDFIGSAAREGPDRTVFKASWEDLLSAVLRLEPGVGGATDTMALTAALSEMPLAPVCGALSVPAPADKLSGSVTLKGPRDRASLSASLDWGRGEGEIKGWLNAAEPRPGSLTLTMTDGAFGKWIAFARALGAPSWIPDADGRVETRGLTIGRDGGTTLVNGWIKFRDITVRGRRAGSGNIRIKTAPGGGEIEGSLESDGASFNLNPTRFTFSGKTLTAAGAFGWRGIAAGMTTCSLSRGVFNARMTGDQGDLDLAVSGLAFGDLDPAAFRITAARSGDTWTVQSPEESEWKLTGALSVSGLKLATTNDSRTGGRWLAARGPGGASLKVDCAMTPPDAPERLVIEARKIPSAPVLLAMGLPQLGGRVDADLAWHLGDPEPLSGRLALAQGKWGDIPLDLIEVRGRADPGRSFVLESVRTERTGELAATGSGSLRLVPSNNLSLAMAVQKLSLGYLKPFGFVEDSDALAQGTLAFSGDPANPGIDGTLALAPGRFKAPAVFTDLRLTEGRVEFRGNRVTIKAVLTDVAGAALVVAGEATHAKLAPDTFNISFSAPAAVRVDGLQRLFRGSAKGTARFEGTLEKPVLRGEVTILEGRLQSPPKRPKANPPSLLDRIEWDLKVRFGDAVDYGIEPVGGAALKLARLSSRSRMYVRGAGDDMKIYGEILADSGPVTLFLGRQLWKKMPAE